MVHIKNIGLCLDGFNKGCCVFFSEKNKCALDFTDEEIAIWRKKHYNDGSLGCLQKRDIIADAVKKDVDENTNINLKKVFETDSDRINICKCGHIAAGGSQHSLCVLSRMDIPYPYDLKSHDHLCNFCDKDASYHDGSKLLINNTFILPPQRLSFFEKIKKFLLK